MLNARTVSIALLVILSIVTNLWLITDAQSRTWVIVSIGIAIPLALLIGALRKSRNWAELIALAMILYATIGVMDVVASAGQFGLALAVSGISVALFISSLVAARH